MLYAAATRRESDGLRAGPDVHPPAEGGASLRASGWENEGVAGGRQWRHTDSKPRRTDQPITVKTRWSRQLNRPSAPVEFPEVGGSDQLALDEVGA